MGQIRARGRDRGNTRMTGADGVSVLPAAMAAALVAAGVAITRSVRKSRAAVQRVKTTSVAEPSAAAGAGTGRRAAGPGTPVPSGQAAVKATVDDDGR